MIETDYLSDTDDVIAKFRKMPLFSALTPESLRELVDICKIRKYHAGEVIIRQGEFDHWLYILISGEVIVVRDDVELGRIRRFGDVFGEMGVISGDARSATVSAADSALCLAMDSSIFDRLSDEHKAVFHATIYRVLSEKLAERLRAVDEELVVTKYQLARYEMEYGELDEV